MRPPPVGSQPPSYPLDRTPIRDVPPFATDLSQTLAEVGTNRGPGSVVDPGVPGRVPLRYRRASRSSSPASTTRCSRARAARWSRCWSGWARGRVPGRADVLRADARNSGYAARGAALVERFRACSASEASSRRRRRARASCASSRRGAAAGYEFTEFLVDVLGVEDVGASFPHRVTLTRRATRCGAARRRPAGAAAARGARDRPRRARATRRSAAASAGPSRSRTPTRRWRCCPTSCATSSTRGAEVCTAADTRA